MPFPKAPCQTRRGSRIPARHFFFRQVKRRVLREEVPLPLVRHLELQSG